MQVSIEWYAFAPYFLGHQIPTCIEYIDIYIRAGNILQARNNTIVLFFFFFLGYYWKKSWANNHKNSTNISFHTS